MVRLPDHAGALAGRAGSGALDPGTRAQRVFNGQGTGSAVHAFNDHFDPRPGIPIRPPAPNIPDQTTAKPPWGRPARPSGRAYPSASCSPLPGMGRQDAYPVPGQESFDMGKLTVLASRYLTTVNLKHQLLL